MTKEELKEKIDELSLQFEKEKDRYIHNYTPNGGILYIFNEEEKKKSGGYDAAIVYWSKVIMPIDKVVERLKSK